MGRREHWFGERAFAWPFGNSSETSERVGFYRPLRHRLKQILPLGPEFDNLLHRESVATGDQTLSENDQPERASVQFLRETVGERPAADRFPTKPSALSRLKTWVAEVARLQGLKSCDFSYPKIKL